jgi:hypothetical protein
MLNHVESIAEVERKIAALEAQRGAPDEPPALDAQIGALRRTRAWHAVRLDQTHPNVGTASLFERSGRSKRSARRAPSAPDTPLSGLALV